MNEIIATKVTAELTSENDNFYFLQCDDNVLRLAKAEGQHELGEKIEGFVYSDKADHLRLTTHDPSATLDHFGWGTVTDVRRDLGVFVDIGLPEKDVVVSVDDLQIPREEWPKIGDQLYVQLRVDKKGKIWGHLAWHKDFWELADPGFDNMHDEDLRAVVYRNREAGTFVYLPDNNMLGFIHASERAGILRIGQELQVRVVGFRKEDRTLYVSAKPRSYEMLEDDGAMILAYLEMMADGFMPLNDKSSPEDIKAQFGISKGQFKKALGGLMKQGKIQQTSAGTELVG